jgi:pimeloyl-ACP methyl ester carboxylesterase
MQREKVEYTKAHTTGGRPSLLAPAGAAPAFRLHARCLVVLFAATACLAPSAPVRAQHPAQPGSSAQGVAQTRAADDASLRPFPINVPDEALVDLHRRIAATRWPKRETVDDFSQGVQLAKIQEVVRYWGTDYDWRKAEAKLNALPQFVTNIDGLDMHFIHVRSRDPNALPLIMTHGWPGSVFELLKVIGPLTDPTAHPAAVTVFPGEIYQAPKSWTERAYHKLIYYHRVDKGGHFAAWEQPQLFAEESRAAFRSLRSSWPAALMRDCL